MFGCLFEPNHDFIEPLKHGGIYPRDTERGFPSAALLLLSLRRRRLLSGNRQ